jgi:4-amino-4-deoxy-L-arabinose transferase-like glycosyltransferase
MKVVLMPEPESNKNSETTTPRSSSGKKERTPLILWLPVIIIAFGFLLRLVALYSQESVGVDSVRYLKFAQNYLSGTYFTQGPTGLRELPDIGYPVLIAIASRTFHVSVETSGYWISLIMGTLTLLVIYLLALRGCGYKVAIYALFIAAACQPLIVYSSVVQTESLFILLLGFSSYLSYAATRRGYNTFWFTIGGIICAYAYLTRGLGITFIFIFPLSVLLLSRFNSAFKQHGVRRKTILGLMFFLFGFIIIALPYLILLNRTYGKLVLSDQSIWHNPRVMHPEVSFSNDPRYDGTLTPDNSEYLINTPEFFKIKSAPPFTWLKAFVSKYLKNQVGIYYYHLRELFPPILLILMAVGLFGRKWDSDYKRIMLLAGIWMTPFLILQPLYYTEARYISPVTIFLMIIAGKGAVNLFEWIEEQLTIKNKKKIKFAFPVLLFLIMLPMMVYPVTHRGGKYSYSELRDAGNFLGTYIHGSGGNGTLAVLPVTGYYAGTEPNLVLPDAGCDIISGFAESKSIDYIVLEERKVYPYRPQLRAALFSDSYPDTWNLIYDNENNSGYKVRIFKLAHKGSFSLSGDEFHSVKGGR